MTKTYFDTKYSPIVMPEPFAGSGSKTLPANTQDDASGFSYPLGFNSDYSSPSSNNGKFVTRAQMNAIGNLATHNDFYHRCGGLNTFDPAFAELIGGYPKGAVLSFVENNQLYYVQSLIDDNKIDFRAGVDGITWYLINYEKPSVPQRVAFFESNNIDATSSFYIGTSTGKINGYITVDETLAISKNEGNKILAYYDDSSTFLHYPVGSGIMIKDITNGDDGLTPAYTGNSFSSAALAQNGWSCLVGDAGWYFAGGSSYVDLKYPNFNGLVEQGHIYKIMIYCGYMYDVDGFNRKVTMEGIKLSGKIRLFYNN